MKPYDPMEREGRASTMPNSFQSPDSPIDPATWDALAELWADDGPEELVELIHVYLEDADRLVGSIRSAIEAKDPAGLERAAHTLKSSSANMGALRASEYCCTFQKSWLAGDVERAKSLLAEFLQIMDKSREALQAECARLSSRSSG